MEQLDQPDPGDPNQVLCTHYYANGQFAFEFHTPPLED